MTNETISASDEAPLQGNAGSRGEEAGVALSASESHLLFTNMLEGYAYCRMIYDNGTPVDFIYLAVNPAFERLTGLKNVVGKNVTEVIPGIRHADTQLFQIYGRVAMSGKPERFEMFVESLNDWYNISVYSPQQDHFTAVFDVITQRKKEERQLGQMKRLYATLSQINQMIVRARTREELFQSICDVSVQFGELSLVWIGLLDHASGDILPVAATGIDLAQWPFPTMNIRSGSLTESLSARALRTGTVTTSEDVQIDPRARIVLDQSQPVPPFHSLASLPFRLNGTTIGVVNFVSETVGFFSSEEELRLLDEIGLDISYALDMMEGQRQKQEAEKMMRQWADAFEHCGHGIVLVDPSTNSVITCNPAFARQHGATIDEMINLPLTGMYAPDEHARIRSQMAESDRLGTVQFEAQKVRPDGSIYQVQVNIVSVRDEQGRLKYRVGTQVDITQRTRAEEALRESEAKFRNIFENHAAIELLIDPLTGVIEDANEAALLFYGWPLDELKQMTVQQLRTQPAEQVLAQMHEVMHQKQAHFESRHRLHDGSERNVEVYSSVIEIAGRPYLHSIIHDITGRKQAEEALRLSEEKYRLLAENVSDVIWILDLDTARFRYVSPSVVQLRGFTAEEVMAQDMSACFTPASTQHLLAVLPARIEEINKGIDRTYTDEIEQYCKDGSTVWTEATMRFSVSAISGHIEIYGVTRNISERKTLQNQLIQAQKTQSIGTLAAGIAHDFNNILGIILGYTTMLEGNRVDQRKHEEYVGIIERNVERGASLVQQILTFARKTEVVFEPLDIPDFVRDFVIMLKETFPKTITFIERFAPDVPKIMGDRTQLHQILLNLCVNARDAMPNGGTITVTVDLQARARVQSRFPSASEERYVCIAITDAGVGMDEATRMQVFDPFFTTKDKGQGTGLGLSVVHGAVKSHHGYIDVESRLGSGTTFSLFFPVSQSLEYNPETSRALLTEIKGGTETILVVEDEEHLRSMVATVLTSKGYHVLTAGDGVEACELYERQRNSICAVITDIGLPKMTGYDEVKALLKIDPQVKVILASGFFEPAKKEEMEGLGVKGFISKPYKPNDVLRMIRSVLDA